MGNYFRELFRPERTWEMLVPAGRWQRLACAPGPTDAVARSCGVYDAWASVRTRAFVLRSIRS